jgi:uroporphyrin-III C-methyltransferase
MNIREANRPPPTIKPMPSSEAQPGTVYLAGAGPGDPGLLTLRTLRLLQTADVILPDDLVTDEVLALASPSALIVPVGKRCGQPRITQAGIHELMLEHARPTKLHPARSVLRLKSGDPLVFGRAAEEIAFLTGARIPFEIVPGITAAFAVAAALKTPLTDRGAASKLIFATAHHAAGKVELAPQFHGAFPQDATLVIYMPGRKFDLLSEELIASGIDAHTPCVAVSRASNPEERITRTTLAALGLLGETAIGPAPLLLLIGHAIQPAADYFTSTTGVTESPGRST